MLVLSRKTTEEIIIGQDTRVRVLRIQGNRVYLGIDAPDDVRVIRAEIEPIAEREKSAKPALQRKRNPAIAT